MKKSLQHECGPLYGLEGLRDGIMSLALEHFPIGDMTFVAINGETTAKANVSVVFNALNTVRSTGLELGLNDKKVPFKLSVYLVGEEWEVNIETVPAK